MPRNKKYPNGVPAEVKGQIRKLLLEDNTIRDIAEQVGVTPAYVSIYNKKNGVRPVGSRGKSGPRHPQHINGTIIIEAKNGRPYRYMKCPYHPYAKGNGYVAVHRLVVEKELKRFLKPDEDVHHIDGDSLNNDPSNLEVLSKSKHRELEHADGSYDAYHESQRNFCKEDVIKFARDTDFSAKNIAYETGCTIKTAYRYIERYRKETP